MVLMKNFKDVSKELYRLLKIIMNVYVMSIKIERL
jgi:hypothetical protein